MLEFIAGVSETVLGAGEGVTFYARDGILQTEIHGTSAVHTIPLVKATQREAGRAVGENLLSAVRSD